MAASARKAIADEGDGRIQLGRLGDFVGFRMRRLQNQFSRDFAAATADLGLRSGLFSSLAIISANPGISQQQLSSTVGLDKSITVQIVDELESRGFAQRERSKVDRRRHSLVTTAEGEAFLEKLFAIMMTVEREVLRQLEPTERAALNDILDRMYEMVTR